MRLARKFYHLRVRDYSLLLRTAVVLLAVRLALWLVPFRSIRTQLPPMRCAGDPDNVDQLLWSVRCVSRLVPAATCLTQALALHLLMSRAGHASCLRIGMLSTNGTVEAHAWLEQKGRVLLGGPDVERYTLLLVIGTE